MGEWSLIYTAIDKVFIIAIAIIGFLIRRALSSQAETNTRLETMLKEILRQVKDTNDRVLKLEEWRIYHMATFDKVTEHISSDIKNVQGNLLTIHNQVDSKLQKVWEHIRGK